VNIEEFALGDSAVHKLDPRLKISLTFAFSAIVALNQDLGSTFVALFFPLSLIVVAGINFKRVLSRLLIVNAFTGMLWLFLPFTAGGPALFKFGPLPVYENGVWQVALITLKCNAITLMIIALLGTSTVFSLVHALSHMGVPNKLAHLFFFCFRYIHVIHEEYHRLLRAMKIRALKPGTNLHTYRAYAYLFGTLLVKSFDRSNRIAAAMKCRGFKNKFYILHHHEMQRQDYMLAISGAILMAIVLVI
jgi:cobalt/nickel transport system permease protein